MRKMKERGFTLIELLLAMTLFSTVMVVATVGFVGINRTFARGVIKKQLSESAQRISDEASKSIRNGSVTSQPLSCSEATAQDGCPSSWSALCFADRTRFFWKSSGAASGMYKDINKNCDATPEIEAATELLSENYRVMALKTDPGDAAGLVRIQGVFATLDRDALTESESGNVYTTGCKGSSNPAARTCAVEAFNFIVGGRGTK